MADSSVKNAACSHSAAKNEATIATSNTTHNDANIIRLSDGLSVDLASLTDPRFIILYRGKRRYIYYKDSDFNIYMKSFVEEILNFEDPSDARLPYLRTFLAYFASSIANIKNICNDEQVSNLVDNVDKTISVNYTTCNTYKYIFGGMMLKLDDSIDLELSDDGLEIKCYFSSNFDAIFNALTAEIKQIAKKGEKLLNSDELSSKNKLFYAFSAGVVSASKPQFSDETPVSVKMQRFMLQKLAGEFYRFNDSPHDDNHRIGVFAVGNKHFRANYGTSAVLVRADSVVSAYYRILNAYDTNIDTVEGYESGLTPLRKTEPTAYFNLSDYNYHKIIFVENTPNNADAAAEAIRKRRAIFHSLGFKPSSVSDIVFLKNGMQDSVLASKKDIISIDYSDIAGMVAKMPKKQAPKTPKTVDEVKNYIFAHSTSCIAVSFSSVPSNMYNMNSQFATNILPETKMPLYRIIQKMKWSRIDASRHYIALDKDSFNKLKLGVSVAHRQKGSSYSNGKMALNIITQAMLKNSIIPNYSDFKHPTEIYFFSYHAVKSAECVKYLKTFIPTTEISENYVVDDDMRLKLDKMAAILADFELKTMVLNVFKHCNSIIGYYDCLMEEDNGCYSYNKIAGTNLFKLLYNRLTERYNTGKYAKNKIIEGFYSKLNTIVEYYDNSVKVFENKDYKALLTDEILKIMELFLFSCQKWGYSIPEKHTRRVQTTITTLISYIKSMFSDYLELEFKIAEICSDANSNRSVIIEDKLKKKIDDLAYYCQKTSYDPSLVGKIGKTKAYSGNVLKDNNLLHLCIERKYNTLCYGQDNDMGDTFFKNICRRVWAPLRTVVNIKDSNIIDNLEADFADFQLFYTEHKHNVLYRDYDNSNAQNYLCFYNLARLFQQFGDSPYPYEYNKQAVIAKMPEILPFISTAFCNVPKIY